MWYKALNKRSWVLFTAFIILGPILLGLGYAFLYSFGLTGILSEGFTLEYWQKTLAFSPFWKSLFFSFFIALFTVLLSATIGLILALKWKQAFHHRRVLLYIPLTIPAIVMAFFAFQFLSKAGFLSRVSYFIGLINDVSGFPDLINDQYGIGILFAHMCMATPFLTIVFLQVYENERIQSFAQLSATLGGSKQDILCRIVLPMILRKAFPVLILYFIFAFGSYEIPLLLGSQSPQMISVFTIQKLQRFDLADIPIAFVSSITYTFFIAIIIYTSSRLLMYQQKRVNHE